MIAQDRSVPSFNISLDKFESGVVYRFKFLNNYFDTPAWRISFKYGRCDDSTSLRQNFTIIGADSSLFDISIDNQPSFEMAPAERMEILIIFKNSSSFSICVEDPLKVKSM
jgi:hypothetical protein